MYSIIKYTIIFLWLGALIALLNSCTEPFDTSGVLDDFESVLVIEATITNESKQQQIRLTRSFEFGVEEVPSESNAKVLILDDQGNEFKFSETEPGLYLSDQVFEAVQNVAYVLSVTTADGKNYFSTPTKLTQITPIGDIVADRRRNNEETEGMSILVNTFDPTNSSNFYRYEYEETFKIIAPQWSEEDLITLSDDPRDCEVDVIFTGDNNERVCYNTNVSNRIILTSTTRLDEDRVSEFEVRFIDRDNYILSHRYSILVRQYVQSPEVYTFFETLNNLSESDNLFSQIQPGLLIGNVFSETNRNEIVLGYFDVSSVSEQRIFFNYDDFFLGEPLPRYVSDCSPFAPPEFVFGGGCNLSLLVRTNAVEYLEENLIPTEINSGPYFVVSPACGDCTVLGSNIVPPFWID